MEATGLAVRFGPRLGGRLARRRRGWLRGLGQSRLGRVVVAFEPEPLGHLLEVAVLGGQRAQLTQPPLDLLLERT